MTAFDYSSPVDYAQLVHSPLIANFVPRDATPNESAYRGCEGWQFRSTGPRPRIVKDAMQIADEAYLFVSDYMPDERGSHCYAIGNGDWIGIQIRLAGAATEKVATGHSLEQPEDSCTITRFPDGSIVERQTDTGNWWKFAYIYLRPHSLRSMLDLSASSFDENTSWLVDDGRMELRSQSLQLQPGMAMFLSDVLSCPFSGVARRAFMRGKSVELLSIILHQMTEQTSSNPAKPRLSSLDCEKLAQIKSMISRDLESNLTLAKLAQQFGFNRAKLARGFKHIYGVSLQAYWRDAKLEYARDLLRNENARVTEVALMLGYSELSSFSRAFSRKFGTAPKDVRQA